MDERHGLACEDCGAPLGGRVGCDRAFHELGARAMANPVFAYRRRAVVDAYCLQHPAYIASLKSFAAHVCGLCAVVERAADPRAARAVWSDLRIPPGSSKPALQKIRSTLTLASVHEVATAEAFRHAIDAWIAAVWSDWSAHHELAREWLDYSITNAGRRQR